MRHLSLLLPLLVALAGPAGAQAPANLAREAGVTASSQASDADGKYGVKRLVDGDANTHWASAGAALPQWVRLEWEAPQEIDTVTVALFTDKPLYASWKRLEVETSDGAKAARDLGPAEQGTPILRLDKPHSVQWVKVSVLAVHEPKTYLGINEVSIYLDPQQSIREPRPVPAPLPRGAVKVLGGRPHPTVYANAADLERARRNAAGTVWAAPRRRGPSLRPASGLPAPRKNGCASCRSPAPAMPTASPAAPPAAPPSARGAALAALGNSPAR